MKKLLFMNVGFIFLGAILLLPRGSSGSDRSGQPECMTGINAVSINFTNTTLTRGQENTVNFSVTNTSSANNWISVVGFGTPAGLGMGYLTPADSSMVAGTNSGPWDVTHTDDVDNAGQYTGYSGIIWATVTADGGHITGRELLMPCETENFSLTVNVPSSAPDSFEAVALGAKYGGGLAIDDQLFTFNVINAATTTTSTVTTLPQTGADPINFVWLAILGLPILSHLRKLKLNS